ncbi:hypothetical protein KZ779_13485 [Escherichia coli]|nr:hypothetical protein [Escherichia coli]CSP58596.1 Uncharacterised protein [Shigella sonnei]
MNGQSLNATVFSQLGNLFAVTVFRCPAGANLQGNRNVHCIDDLGKDRFNDIRVLQEG